MGPHGKSAGSLHAGLVLADDQYEAAATRHLQSRLGTLYGVMAGAAFAFYVVYQAVPLLEGEWALDKITGSGALVHLGIVLLAVGIFARLRAGPIPRSTLRVLDGAALYLGAGAALAFYALEFEKGPRDVVAVTALFVVARAVVIPSSPWTTFFLSLPIPVALLVIDVESGVPWTYSESPMDPEYTTSVRVWNQVVLFFGIAIATVTSRLTASLRARLDAAHRIGQYRLDEKIGEGGMGEVYLATHAMLRRPTAVKLLRPELLGEETIARFDQEVRLASRLAHPNTIRIFDYGRTPEGVFYYAMEHVHGRDLERIVARNGPLPAGRVIHVLEQVCRSLAEAHGLGLVHRDIKPGNIMLCEKGGEYDVVKLVDFGLARDLRHANSVVEGAGTVCGTPETISPEILRGEPASPACDLYAVGAVGAYLLTGRPIFDVTSGPEFLFAHLETEPIPPSQRGAQVPAALETLLLQCLRKEPVERPPSAAALGEALRACDGAADWTRDAAAAWWAAFEVDERARARPDDAPPTAPPAASGAPLGA